MLQAPSPFVLGPETAQAAKFFARAKEATRERKEHRDQVDRHPQIAKFFRMQNVKSFPVAHALHRERLIKMRGARTLNNMRKSFQQAARPTGAHAIITVVTIITITTIITSTLKVVHLRAL